jgi:hypothetical protein
MLREGGVSYRILHRCKFYFSMQVWRLSTDDVNNLLNSVLVYLVQKVSCNAT